MNQSNDFADEQARCFYNLIENLQKITHKYDKEKERTFKNVYDKLISTKDIYKTGTLTKQFSLVKPLIEKDNYEQFLIQFLNQLKELNAKLFKVNVTELLILAFNHIEDYKQKTIKFCNCIQQNISSIQFEDSCRDFGEILKPFHDLKMKFDNLQAKSEIDELGPEIELETNQFSNFIQEIQSKHCKSIELDSINFDQLADDLTDRSFQFATKSNEFENKKKNLQKEIDFKINLVLDKIQINLNKFEDCICKYQNDELNLNEFTRLAGEIKKCIFNFEFQNDNEDKEFNKLMSSISLSLDNFVSKLHYIISDCLEKSFYERSNLDNELTVNLIQLATEVLSKKLFNLKNYNCPKDLKLDIKKLNLQKGLSKDILQKKLDTLNLKRITKRNRYTKDDDLLFKTTDLTTVIKGSFKGNLYANDPKMNEVKDKLFKMFNTDKKENLKDKKGKDIDKIKEKIQKMFNPKKRGSRKRK